MNFKEMQAFNRLPHTSCPDISMHTISILSSEKCSPSRSPTLQYIRKFKKNKIHGPHSNYTESEQGKERMLESAYQQA